MDKKILYDLIKTNPNVAAREALAKYVDNTEFTMKNIGKKKSITVAEDNNNPRIRFQI